MKAVDLIADFVEKELERAGIATFFEDVRDMSEDQLQVWLARNGRKMNDNIDFPMLNEDQEEVVIEFVLRLAVEKFIRGEKDKGFFGLKLPFT